MSSESFSFKGSFAQAADKQGLTDGGVTLTQFLNPTENFSQPKDSSRGTATDSEGREVLTAGVGISVSVSVSRLLSSTDSPASALWMKLSTSGLEFLLSEGIFPIITQKDDSSYWPSKSPSKWLRIRSKMLISVEPCSCFVLYSAIVEAYEIKSLLI
jgi:hypothetical protein